MTRRTTSAAMTRAITLGLAALSVGAAVPAVAEAQIRRIGAAPGGADGAVNLPYMIGDGAGSQWRVYPSGYLQQQGNMPVYSQGAMAMVNGNQPQSAGRAARMDAKTGELILENMNAGGIAVTRRVAFDKENNVVRYVDVFKNATGQEQSVNLMVQTSLNYGINNSQLVADPKKGTQQVGWAGLTGANVAAMEMFNGKGAKTPLVINYQQGNNVVGANLQVSLAPGKEVAVMHLHGVFPNQEAAAQYMLRVKETDLLKKIPPNIRRLIVNFAGGGSFIGDTEVLRGDLLDVVELRSGDQLKGTIQDPAFELTTAYGPVSLPVDKVIGLLNVGTFRPRHLVVLADGQIFGGTLKQEALTLQLSSGQVTKVPLAQVSRAGYRKRAGEPDEWTFDKPLVVTRAGERVSVKMPAAPLEVATRYGKLSVKPDQLASAVLQSEETGLHQFTLTDGSKFSGLLTADAMELQLDAGGAASTTAPAAPVANGGDSAQPTRFPVSAIAKFQLAVKAAEPDDITPTVKLANDDLLVGTLTGTLKLDTAFDTLPIAASEIREMRHPAGGGADVQVVTFDGSTVSGQLRESELQVELASGLKVQLPLALLEEYRQPQPLPGKEMEQKIVAMVKDLADADWKVRDRAQAGLLKVGPVATGVLRKMRAAQPADAQGRIDAVLKELDAQRAKAAKTTTGSAVAPGGGGNFVQPAPIPMQIQREVFIEN